MRAGASVRLGRTPRSGMLRVAYRRAALLLLASTIACRGSMTSRDSTLTILYDADERLFGPYWSVEAWFLMFLPLVSWDEHGEVAPALARSWEHSPDSRSWTFHLRSDVRWHDGVPTTAQDVKFTIELQGRPDVLFDDAWVNVDSILVPDDTTLTIHYSRPRDALNDWMVYWPKHLLEGLDPAKFLEWDFWTHPVGNGPYRHVRHVEKTMVELEANPDFYAGPPRIPRVIIAFGGAAPVPQLLSGDVDVVSWANSVDLPALAADDRFRVYYQLAPSVPWLLVLAWNEHRPPLDDARVRRAFTAAVDRRELLGLLNLPPDIRLADAPYTPRQYRMDALPASIPFDTSEAARLLDAAGWHDTDGDGIRDRDGKPLHVTIIGRPDWQATAVYVQAALRRVGVDAALELLERRILQPRFQGGDFDGAIQPFWNAPDSHVEWLGSGLEAGRRREAQAEIIGYHNAAVASLLAAARATVDLSARDSLYALAAPLVLQDAPITFLYPTVQTYVVTRNLQGLVEPYRADPMQFLQDLWLENRH